jgi:PAS domain S-box-containing protein
MHRFCQPEPGKMFGVGPGELIGARAMDFIVEEDHDRVYARRDDIIAHKDGKSISEYRLLNANGEIRSALISSQHINWQGEDAFLSVISDITELKQVEESLSAIANTASEAIGIFQDEHMVYCNPAMITTFGYTFEELQGKPFHQFVHPDDRAMLYERYNARQAGEEVPAQYDYRLIGKDGETVWVMISAGITQWKGRIATVTILTNVTDRKKAEEAVRLAKEDLEIRVEERTKDLRVINDQLIAISNQKSAFVSAASHELRTPLASILGFSALVRKVLDKHVAPAVNDPALEEKIGVALENLDIIKLEGDRLTRLLDDMLDVSKIEAGQADWRDKPLSVQSLVEDALAVSRIKLDAKPKVALKAQSENPSLRILADPDRIMQVVTNLLDNAIKFTEQGEIVISTQLARKDVLELRITDTGTGMTERERGLVFQKYYQAESPSKGISKAPKGTGLGLAICKEIIEHYQGMIGVESGPDGVGSSFYFRLPLLKD